MSSACSKHVVDIRQRTLEEDEYYRLASEQVLATACVDNGQTQEAIEILERLVKIRKTPKMGNYNPQVSEHHLARAYRGNGQIQEAIKLWEHVAEIHRQTLKEEDPDRLHCQVMVAIAYMDNGQTQESIKLWKYVAEIYRRTFEKAADLKNPPRHWNPWNFPIFSISTCISLSSGWVDGFLFSPFIGMAVE